MNNFFDNRVTKIKKAPSCCARREGSENVPFDLERSISKFDLRARSGHDLDVTQLGQVAYQLRRLRNTSPTMPFASS